MNILYSKRLKFEPFCDAHLEGLYRMNSDPEVMRYITGKPETREQTQLVIARVQERWKEWGCSWWSLIERDTGDLVGAGAVQYLGKDPANELELGWRLRRDKWGMGYASEAARIMAAFAFERFDRNNLTAICHPDNHASSHVMKKLGMHFRGMERWIDMDCATYEISRATWEARQKV